jgi:hypothetical protein
VFFIGSVLLRARHRFGMDFGMDCSNLRFLRRHTYSDTYSDTYSNAYPYSDADADAYSNAYTDSERHPYARTGRLPAFELRKRFGLYSDGQRVE